MRARLTQSSIALNVASAAFETSVSGRQRRQRMPGLRWQAHSFATGGERVFATIDHEQRCLGAQIMHDGVTHLGRRCDCLETAPRI
jgi:hypothetical protein